MEANLCNVAVENIVIAGSVKVSGVAGCAVNSTFTKSVNKASVTARLLQAAVTQAVLQVITLHTVPLQTAISRIPLR